MKNTKSYNLAPGTGVVVKSWEEIASTIDENDALVGVPPQAEMKNFCGKRFDILEMIDRIIIEGSGLRAIKNVVLLEGARCSGEAHRGCQRRCMFFFRPEWLELDVGGGPQSESESSVVFSDLSSDSEPAQCQGQSCVLMAATTPLRYRHLRQYTRGINWPMFAFLSGRNLRWCLGRRRQSPVNKSPTPDAPHIAPGDLIRVRDKKEILATLNRRGRYRGLAFVGSMLRYCGGTYRVLDRVSRLIDEKTGVMREISDAVILEDVICTGELYGGCPRRCYWLWRGAWLEKQ